jgi:alpha-beta hydrolase superfamily lysophospholipase
MRLHPFLHALGSIAAFAWVASSQAANPQERPVPPSQDPFYLVPKDIARAKPGEILQHRRPLSTFEAYGFKPPHIQEAHQILYRTADNVGNATATVLTVFIPQNANMSNVVSFHVAEDAASVDCAPSFGFQSAVLDYPSLSAAVMQLQLLIIESALARGWVVVVPDFQGPMGAYAANRLAGQAILDGIRAALQSGSTTGIPPNADVVLWGYSGGAAVTESAASMQPIYAPELKLKGAALGGIGPNATSLDQILKLNKDPRTGLLATALVGLSNQYPAFEKALDAHLDSQYREKFYSPRKECLDKTLETFFNVDLLGWFSDFAQVFADPVVLQIGDDSVKDLTTPETPMLWYQTTHDELVDIKEIDARVEKFCAEGVVIDYIKDTAPNLLHKNYGVVGASDALKWIEARFEARNESTECTEKTISTPYIDPDFLKLFPDNIVQALEQLVGAPNRNNTRTV